jgi:hypothetical protein
MWLFRDTVRKHCLISQCILHYKVKTEMALMFSHSLSNNGKLSSWNDMTAFKFIQNIIIALHGILLVAIERVYTQLYTLFPPCKNELYMLLSLTFKEKS